MDFDEIKSFPNLVQQVGKAIVADHRRES